MALTPAILLIYTKSAGYHADIPLRYFITSITLYQFCSLYGVERQYTYKCTPKDMKGRCWFPTNAVSIRLSNPNSQKIEHGSQPLNRYEERLPGLTDQYDTFQFPINEKADDFLSMEQNKCGSRRSLWSVVRRNVNGLGNERLLLGIQSRRIIVNAADNNAVRGLLKEVIS
jgi:hypothetical protein